MAVVAGILAALAMPSMMGMQGRNNVQAVANQVKGALQEAQRAAIRNGRSCTVSISATGVSSDNTGTNPTCITSPVTASDTSSKQVRIQVPSGSDLADPATSLTFSYKGNTTTNLTLVMASARNGGSGSRQYQTNEERCIVISSGIGIMRSGIYSGGNCTASF